VGEDDRTTSPPEKVRRKGGLKKRGWAAGVDLGQERRWAAGERGREGPKGERGPKGLGLGILLLKFIFFFSLVQNRFENLFKTKPKQSKTRFYIVYENI
jgi:hypothetical protein